MMVDPKLICLTPCRNEAWVIDIHLKAASLWADHIIVGDQMSDDGTREIVARYAKAILVDNHAQGYDEGERHRVSLRRRGGFLVRRFFLLLIRTRFYPLTGP
jgi:hypothetical protein